MINLRFTPELFQIIKRNAAEQNIGVGLYIVRLLEDILLNPKIRGMNEQTGK